MLMYDVLMILPSHSIQFPPLHVVLRQQPWKITAKLDSLYYIFFLLLKNMRKLNRGYLTKHAKK